MPGGFDVQFEQDVLVVADPGGFDLGKDLARFLGRWRRGHGDPLVQGASVEGRRRGEYALALAATAADRLQADAVLRIARVEFGEAGKELGAEFLYGVHVDALATRGVQHRVHLRLERHIRAESRRRNVERLCGSKCLQRVGIRVFAQQGERGQVVDAGRHADAHGQRGALGLVLEAGPPHRATARPDEAQPRLLQRLHQLLVLGHEAVSGKDRVVAVVVGDGDDLVDTLSAFLSAGARVVGHPMHPVRIRQRAQLGR